ncbi:MAG TPA: nuclease-related domain-containing protein [Bradyrhizobium sp.]|uniref:nuclease-related domain-containing protein n=1 Tax=Bradyrhizobium sp. TaxID=376 RepID=UPI002C781583|nr:nuclease-related domain-containing protein [Bradyrhizobium sp.]HLZ02569.1 nuclease-related domain-containing protein [Bradyrhizobium sp.]
MFHLDDLRKITRATGFIHTLSSIVVNESIFYSAHQIKTRNRFDLISFNEVALLLSLMSEAPLDLSFPDSHEAARQYQACKAALDALHDEISSFSRGDKIEDLFTAGQHFIEPIFYAAGAGFWFDYLSLAPRLYELDKQFLFERGYEIEEFSALLREMQAIFKTRLRDFIREQRKNIRKIGLVASPFVCFVFSPSDIPQAQIDTYKKFIDRFSVEFGKGPIVKDPLDYHPCKARPALRLSDTQIFVPLVPMLCEQLYESPFYTIAQDKSYFASNANNRGLASELMLGEILRPIEHLELIRDVKVKYHGSEIGQIDLVAVFGAAAIIFEVKTKRLTQASKSGSTKDLINDIQAGILEAQRQLAGIKSALLSKAYDNISWGCPGFC